MACMVERRVEEKTSRIAGQLGTLRNNELRVPNGAMKVLRISSSMQDWYYSSHGAFGRSTKGEYLKIAGKLDSFKQAHFWLATRGLDLRPWQGSQKRLHTSLQSNMQPDLDPFLPPKVCPGTCQPHKGSSRQIRSLGAFWNTAPNRSEPPAEILPQTSPLKEKHGKRLYLGYRRPGCGGSRGVIVVSNIANPCSCSAGKLVHPIKWLQWCGSV